MANPIHYHHVLSLVRMIILIPIHERFEFVLVSIQERSPFILFFISFHFVL